MGVTVSEEKRLLPRGTHHSINLPKRGSTLGLASRVVLLRGRCQAPGASTCTYNKVPVAKIGRACIAASCKYAGRCSLSAVV